MSQSGDMSVVGKALLDFGSKWMLPFILAFVSWQYNEIDKLNQRVTQLQKESVTQAALQVTESRVVSYMDVRIGDISARQDLANKYLQILVEQSKEGKRR